MDTSKIWKGGFCLALTGLMFIKKTCLSSWSQYVRPPRPGGSVHHCPAADGNSETHLFALMSSTHHATERVRIAVAIAAWSGVLLQLWLYFIMAHEKGKPASAAWIAFTGYFTIFTNLFIALICTLPSWGVKFRSLAWLDRLSVRGCAVTASLLVAIAYHFLLRELWAPQGMQWIADIILHYVVPGGALAHWAIMRHPVVLPWTLPLRWCSYPFIFLGYAMVRGEILDSYPYPFIDVNAIGYPQAILNACALILGYSLLGFLVLWISRLRCGALRDSIAK